MTSNSASETQLDLKTQVEALRVDLEYRRGLCVEQLQRLAIAASRERTPPSDQPSDDVSPYLQEATRVALSEIDAALQRLDAGTYGTCERCGTSIPLERLRALPMAPMCMPCQLNQERAASRHMVREA